jgi:phospholipid/cholesterol/gamma-HCH transport system substrate-binding protein
LRSRVLRAAVLVCVGALTLSGCDFSVYSLPLPGGASLGDHPYTVHVEFRDVLDLVPQSAVKVDDVSVGRVDKIDLRGYTADVTLRIRGDVKLPDNAVADIQQTSLLGEKFVSLAPPTDTAPEGRLGNGDTIPLSRSGRNPEVEEVLGALSLLLNGGGVAQLKTIATELNKALSGREGNVRSVLSQLDGFMKQIDSHKNEIVTAIESLDRLAISLNKQKGTIQLALDKLPQAIASINRQRDDLVKMLRALSRLSAVGVRVIGESKAATIDSLRSLAPTLTKLAQAGDSLPKSLQVFLTYPFVDAVVGKNPAQARNLHMGDYTDLSIKTDLDLTHGLTAPGLPPPPNLIAQCKATPAAPVCDKLTPSQLKQLCKASPNNPLCDALGQASGGGGGGTPSLPSLPKPSTGTSSGGSGSGGSGSGGSSGCSLVVLCPRAAPDYGPPTRSQGTALTAAGGGIDRDLGALLLWGMVQR